MTGNWLLFSGVTSRVRLVLVAGFLCWFCWFLVPEMVPEIFAETFPVLLVLFPVLLVWFPVVTGGWFSGLVVLQLCNF